MTITQDSAQRAPDRASVKQRRLGQAVTDHPLVAVGIRASDRTRSPSADRRFLGDLVISDIALAVGEGERSPGMVREGPASLLLINTFVGEEIFVIRNETVILSPGNVLLLDSSVSGKVMVPRGLSKRTVQVPMEALAPLDTGRGIPNCMLLPAEQNPLGSVMNNYLVSVRERLDQMSAVEVEGARNALLSLITAMIRAAHEEVDTSDFEIPLREQLEAWIVSHLTSGPVTVRELAAAHNIAPRTVHRVFARTGDTFGSIMRAHRIAGAQADLRTLSSSIATIAHRWGFYDASHFGREFRRELSMSPREFREAHAGHLINSTVSRPGSV